MSVAMPSRFLQEIPEALIDWRQSPGEVTSRGGTASRALNAAIAAGCRGAARTGWGGRVESAVSFGNGGGSGAAAVSEPASGNMQSALEQWRERKRAAKAAQASGGGFPNTIGLGSRDNGDLALEIGDRVRHDEYGEGRVVHLTGAGTKRIAHVDFESVGERKLLVKLAPITKVE